MRSRPVTVSELPLAVTPPVPVWLDVKLLKLVVPVRVCVLLLPLKITVLEAPGVNVPVLAQSPATFKVVIVPAAKVPAVILRLPFRVSVVVLPPPDSVWPVLLTVRLLKVWLAAVPLMFCAAVVLLKVIVDDPGVNVPPLLVQLPAIGMFVIVPTANVPEVSNIVPLRVSDL